MKEFVGHVAGGLIGGAIAVVCLVAWMRFEDWRQTNGH